MSGRRSPGFAIRSSRLKARQALRVPFAKNSSTPYTFYVGFIIVEIYGKTIIGLNNRRAILPFNINTSKSSLQLSVHSFVPLT